ncbi:hypothetical protein MBCUT_01200 [Methanobrevibacter cuticularis]|uniref:CRISPR-associated exonuclease Cas4 n=1 Tax=Methanobrevibacter cuticularis TaxID=47311 RepID=A0A166FG79_9EURY|nr:CRISPR-associated protein Cas4 [Methanobrevibacter cuticularis]KZX17642.1 hypothetical protein MBCUT_01200 [Methanobrevibacter cuticularis]
MISIATIRTYMFCPLKLYLENSLNNEIKKDILLYKTMKELRIDLQDLSQRNLRRLRKDMTLTEIEANLNKNIEEYIENSIAVLENSDFIYEKNISKSNSISNNDIKYEKKFEKVIELNKTEKLSEIEVVDEVENLNEIEVVDEVEKLNEIEVVDEVEKLKNEIQDEIYFNMKILALKAQKAMIANDKDGTQIAELFFPTSMYSYLMRDPQLEIMGSCDKIEIIDGKYYPINIRPSNPPMRGVWDGDSIELVASALLIEEEFNTEVFVGFIDYLKIGERRPVVMDSNLRKGLFKTINEIKDIINEEIVPDIIINKQKCLNCEYNEICHQDDDLN